MGAEVTVQLIFSIMNGWIFIEDVRQINSLDQSTFLPHVTLFTPRKNECGIASKEYIFQARLHSFLLSVNKNLFVIQLINVTHDLRSSH